ncbi:response regulator transcription factor [Sandaracinobacteroides saxicola]|uniref:Response regulator transcription factor n=1 Tax=Sandaracinobacteroides saxicola TaxID=2759707 RepID=A0A7G5IM84_9SPHN|nr:response regulator transcription factor [Sandaracinobacteroides saxicola]
MTIVIAEDQALVLSALSRLLSLETDFTIAGSAADGQEALQVTRSLRPDVLILDIEMPGMLGLDVAAMLHAERARTRVIMLTTFARQGYLQRAMAANVAGFLLKDSPVDVLTAAVRKVAAGQRAIDPKLGAMLWDFKPDQLSDRERSVIRLAEEGRSNKDIARALGLSPGTVRNYLSFAASKLGAANRQEAGRIARENGWL